MAFQTRGFTNLVLDMIDNPKFVHRLMRYLTDAHVKWYEDRKKHLGIPVGKAQLFNDEVDNNIIGPNTYRDFILPYEKEETTNTIPLEICLRAVDDVFLASPEKMREKVNGIMATCAKYDVKAYLIRGGSLNPVNDILRATASKS